MVNLILGLIRPSKGKIFLNNNRLNNKLYEKVSVSYVPQKFFLTDSTIKKNILLASKNNQDQFNEALKISNLINFVSKLKNKTNTMIGEDAKKISMGQKQRIGIARAVYKKFDILILK